MSEWKEMNVDEIKSIEPRSIISGPFGSNISSKYFVDKGIPVIRGNNLSNQLGVKFIDDGFVYLTNEKADELHTWALEDDLVFTAAGTIGQVGIIQRTRYDKYIISNKQLRLRVNKDLILPLFAYYYFANPKMVETIVSMDTGSTIPLINLSVLKTLPILVPPLPDQKAISGILSSLDDKIDLLHRNNKTLEAMAETIFRQWFMEEAKEEWETVSLYDVLDIMSGGTPSTKCSEFWDGDIPWFTPKDITDSPYCICTQKQITELGLAKCNSMLFEPETVFITARGTVGKVAICAVNMAINQSCYALKSRNGLHASFVYLLMKNAVKSIQQNASGAVFDAIVVDTFKAIEYILPTADSEVYDRFEEICYPLFEKIKINTIHIQSLESLRDTLLPKLISGEVKVDMGGKIIDY